MLSEYGSGHFRFQPDTYYPTALTTMLVQLGDINNDGKIDIVSVSPASPSTFSMFLNTTKLIAGLARPAEWDGADERSGGRAASRATSGLKNCNHEHFTWR